jgi:uncharacterized membrane protein
VNGVASSQASAPQRENALGTLSLTDNKVLMAKARKSLEGHWGLAVGTFVVYLLLLVAIEYTPKVGWIISALISGPMAIGIASFSLYISREQNAKLEQIFRGFKQFGAGLGAYLLQFIFIFLWSLLLIVPGVIAALSYSMTYFVIAGDDSIGPLEAITKGKEMMRGNRWKLFCLGCRFVGWSLLCILTLGIGFLWLIPYMWVSGAQFYDDLKEVDGVVVKPQMAGWFAEGWSA